jgi:hypothetical protein
MENDHAQLSDLLVVVLVTDGSPELTERTNELEVWLGHVRANGD